MDRLCKVHPPLLPFIFTNKVKGHSKDNKTSHRSTIDFSNLEAVRALNAALLAADYGIDHWSELILNPTFLCPPIPGRADYIHHVADILGDSHAGDDMEVPTGPSIRGLDIGTGATLIYPLLGTQSYGWSFVATDIDPQSIASSQAILQANVLEDTIEVRLQSHQNCMLQNLFDDTTVFDFVMCNPPFYESAAAYQKENNRKVRNLQKNSQKRNPRNQDYVSAPSKSTGSNNFGGGPSELWYPGGEVAFVTKLIQESWDIHSRKTGAATLQCLWFSSLISRKDHLPQLIQRLEQTGVKNIRVVPMGQGGSKTSNILFWSFYNVQEQEEWFHHR